MVYLIPAERLPVEAVKLKSRDIRETLRSGKRMTELYKQSEKRVLKVLRQYVFTEIKRKLQDNEPLNLYLREERIMDATGLTKSETKKAKVKLSEAGIIYVPKDGRQKGEGTYPVWFLNFDFVEITHSTYDVEDEQTPKRKHWGEMQGPYVAALYHQVKKEHRQRLDDAGVEAYLLEHFMMVVSKDLSQRLKRLERDWLLV